MSMPLAGLWKGCLQVGTWSVDALSGKIGEIVDMLVRGIQMCKIQDGRVLVVGCLELVIKAVTCFG